MLDVTKLRSQVEATAGENASKELDRMIEIHEKEAAIREDKIKQYLLKQTIPGTVANYVSGSADAPALELGYHRNAVKELKKLRKQLKKAEKSDETV